ncbi:hypothetical protein P43SY_004501 [Pythium insidiosum]|uniref:RRM domain-containing protein n=1 Tax=Pythium insidiosum TaxID=114742 RepID=A0AAD5M3F9_PYTIN|nr:hypothetical protein P43SY_004501 [Pythium insidiosum]
MESSLARTLATLAVDDPEPLAGSSPKPSSGMRHSSGSGSSVDLDDGDDDMDFKSVYIGNVNYGTTKFELREHFRDCGNMKRITIPCDPATKQQRGFAYIEFSSPSEVLRAIKLNGSTFRGRPVKVSLKHRTVPNYKGVREGRDRGASTTSNQSDPADRKSHGTRHNKEKAERPTPVWKEFEGDASTPLEDLEAFLDEYSPSKWTQDKITWIAVRCRGYGDDDDNNQRPDDDGDEELGEVAMVTEWKAICRMRKPSAKDLDELARKHKVVSGKWMIFRNTETVDDAWTKIARAVLQSHLGDAAKVSPVSTKPQQGNSHVICVYVPDFTNTDDVLRVRDTLRALGIDDKIMFKPDAYTHCGIYSKNPWGILTFTHHA